MDNQIKLVIWSILASTLRDSGLLYNNNKPVPRRRLKPEQYDKTDADIMDFYKYLDLVTFHGTHELKKAKAAVDALPKNENKGNHILVALQVAMIGLSETKVISNRKIYLHATRLVDIITEEIRGYAATGLVKKGTITQDQVSDYTRNTIRSSHRIADNLVRFIEGRPILDKELRDKQRHVRKHV